MNSREQKSKQKLSQQQLEFEQQLFGANKQKTEKQQQLQQQQQQQIQTEAKQEMSEQSEFHKTPKKSLRETKDAPEKLLSSTNTNRDRTPVYYLYDSRESHPIIEYLPSKEDSESATLTPSFVLEVTWPRIIQFYHPSSPRCQSLQSIYVSLARGIKRRSSRLPVEFHAVNCGVYREVCEQGFNVKSVPTIIGLRSGRIDGTEMSLPGNMDGDVGSKKEQAKDIELKVEYIASMMGIPLDAVKGHHAGSAFARSMGIDSNEALVESEISPVDESSQKDLPSEGFASIPTSEHEVFFDARSSLLATLTSSLYSQFPHGSALPHKTSTSLAEFLDLIRWAFPPETKVHDLAEDLKLEYFSISTSEDGLLKVLGRHMDLGTGITWSSRCGSQAKGGYACGLWALLHILSIGVAERHTSVVGDAERVSVNHAGQVMRSFVDNFFVGCDSCRESWIELYDEACCGLDGTGYSILGSSAVGKAEEWRNLAIWIWKVHNSVTILREQSAGKGYYHKQSRMASSSSLWPSKSDCANCWQSLTDDTGLVMNMDSFDQKELYNHLKKIYWPGGVHNNRLIVLDRWSKAKRALSMKRLRARMAAHDWSISVFILHILVAYLMIRILFPRWCINIGKRVWNKMYLVFGCGGRDRHGRKHRKRQQAEQIHVGRIHYDSNKPGWNRHRTHHPDRSESSRASRSCQAHDDSFGIRTAESQHYPRKMSHHRVHEGRRRRSGSRAYGSHNRKKDNFNYFLEL